MMDSESTLLLQNAPKRFPSSSWISNLFIWWVTPTVFRGWKKSLNFQDLDWIPTTEESQKWGRAMTAEWSSCTENSKTPSLFGAIRKVFFGQYLFATLLIYIEECIVKVLQFMMLGYLIRYFDGEFRTLLNGWVGWILSGGIVSCFFLSTFLHAHSYWITDRCGMRIRLGCSFLMYSKVLKLNQSALGKATVGQMVNLISTDLGRFDTEVTRTMYLWVAPVHLILVSILLWSYFGVYSTGGIAIILFLAPFQVLLGKYFGRLRTKVAGCSDKRSRCMNEIISGIKVIKMYAWEPLYIKLVEKLRIDEIKYLRFTGILKSVNQSFFNISGKVMIFLILFPYVLAGNPLNAEMVFVSLSLCNAVGLLMTRFFPIGVNSLADQLVAIKRMERFLLNEEKSGEGRKENENWGKNRGRIRLENAGGQWGKDAGANWKLSDISLQLGGAQLMGVIGSVGSGKSTLLQLLLGELPHPTGSLELCGTIAYAPQEPWLFSGSVRENILFGRGYERVLYERTISACALERDFHQLQYGDATLVGEKGVALSGGQKARICLARTVYSDADIYLLDDPLSAVDPQVAQHIFHNCIQGLLKDKVRILVTHQLQFLKEMDQVLYLSEGSVKFQGPPGPLLQSDFHLPSTHSNILSGGGRRNKTQTQRKKLEITLANKNGENSNSDVTAARVPEETSKSQEMRLLGFYWKYYRAGSHTFTLLLWFIIFISTQIFLSLSDFFLEFWTKHKDVWGGGEGGLSYEPMWIYSALVSIAFILSLGKSIWSYLNSLSSSMSLHSEACEGLVASPLRFFEVNSAGRILNIFSKDFGIIDQILPNILFDVLDISFLLLGVIAILSVLQRIILLPSAVLIVSFYYLRKLYLRTAKRVKHIESVRRSPVFAHLSTTFYGLSTIRAFKMEQTFAEEFHKLQDDHSVPWYMFFSTSRWLAIMLDLCCGVFVTVVMIVFLVYPETDGSSIGLAVSSILTLSLMLQLGIRQSAEADNNMVSVQRVLEYINLPPEQLKAQPTLSPPKEWPSAGEIVISNLSLRYDDTSPPVLKGISCTFKAGEKIGIVGRTGSGKSSIVRALFRLTEPDPCSSISIDGVDIGGIELSRLRSKISILPQDPVLFVGSLRRNLDPFEDYHDAQLWEVLRQVQMAKYIGSLPEGLEYRVAEGGSNFSVGQKQLICLAKAILKENKIIVLDEATANVDPRTDDVIQRVIREKFCRFSVITIAHRLHTVIDSDKILALDEGRIKEFGEPKKLLQDTNSWLYKLSEMQEI